MCPHGPAEGLTGVGFAGYRAGIPADRRLGRAVCPTRPAQESRHARSKRIRSGKREIAEEFFIRRVEYCLKQKQIAYVKVADPLLNMGIIGSGHGTPKQLQLCHHIRLR